MMVNVLDPKLPWIASNAAVELDLLIHGEKTDLDAVKQLGERLRQSVDSATADQATRSLQVNTETETILSQAFAKAGADADTILSELFRRTEEIAQELSSAEAGTARQALEQQRAFCLALSQAAAAYRQSIYDVRPPHPYKK